MGTWLSGRFSHLIWDTWGSTAAVNVWNTDVLVLWLMRLLGVKLKSWCTVKWKWMPKFHAMNRPAPSMGCVQVEKNSSPLIMQGILWLFLTPILFLVHKYVDLLFITFFLVLEFLGVETLYEPLAFQLFAVSTSLFQCRSFESKRIVTSSLSLSVRK